MTTTLPVLVPQSANHRAGSVAMVVLDPTTGVPRIHHEDRRRAAQRAEFLVQVARLISIRKAAGL